MVNSIKKYVRMIEKHFEKTNRQSKAAGSRGHATIRINSLCYVIRPVSPADIFALFQMHQRLSKETLFYRYLALRRPTITEMETICSLSVSEGAAFVAQRKDKSDTIVGLVYYRFDPTHPKENPEFAIVVEDRFQGCGIGKALLKYLCRYAAEIGINGLNASIHPLNRRMRSLLNRADHRVTEKTGFDKVEATVHLQSDTAVSGNGFFGLKGLADPLAGLNI